MSEASIQQDYHDVKILAADERLLLAQALWVKVDAYLESRAVGELGASCLMFVGGRGGASINQPIDHASKSTH